MHAFVDQTLIVFDAFGLTRIAGGKAKHNKKVVGEFLVANGSLLIGHSEVSNNRFAMSVPDLKVVPVDDKWNYNLTYGTAIAVTPEGLPFEAQAASLVIYKLDGKQLASVDIAPKKLKATIDFGPVCAPDNYAHSATVTMGPDGTFVIFGDGQIVGGKLAGGKKPVVEGGWSVPAGRTQGQLRLRAGAFGAFISSFHAVQGKAYCALVSAGKVQSQVVDCIAPVDFDGTRIAYQVSPTEVHRRPFGGEPDRITLPASAAGIGEVMADGDRLLFVTADHEQVRDLMNDEVIERGLPDVEKAARKKVLAFMETFRAPAAAGNLHLRLKALRPPAYGMGPRPDYGWNAGDQSLVPSCVIGNFLARSFADRELSAGSWSNMTSITAVKLADVERLFEVIDQHDLDFLAGLSMLESPLENHWDMRFGSGNKKPKPVLEKPAGRALLWAIIECLGAKKQPRLAGRGWDKRDLTPAMLIEKIDPATAQWRRGDHSDAQKAAGLIAFDYFEDEMLPIVIDWLLTRPSGMVDANMHIHGDVAKALVNTYPKTKPGFDKAIAAVIAGKDQERAQKAQYLQGVIAR